MSNLKDSLNQRKKTITLSAEQINFLTHISTYAQTILDQMQQYIASEYLRMIVIKEHGMSPTKDLLFDFHPEREADNLTITEMEKKK